METHGNDFNELAPGEAPDATRHGDAAEEQSLSMDALRTEGFEGFNTFAELRDGSLTVPPDSEGAYVVVRRSKAAPIFLEKSCGGWFKGKDPTVAVDLLEQKWVPDAEIVYVGKADIVRRRLAQFASFGAGRRIGHWGGRYIWQLADSDELSVAWRSCADDESPTELEARLIGRFKEAYGRLPFANIADPSASRINQAAP